MKINILHLLEGAKAARGLTVIIDVFRAFSVACYATDKGVKKIIPVGNIEKAYALKKTNPDFLLVGERKEKKPEGFDFGNSPSSIIKGSLKNKTMVHTTSSGTQGLVNAVHATEIITGSFVNAEAIIQYIRNMNPEEVSLVCMGYALQYPTEEDTLCAEYIAKKLERKESDFSAIKEIIRETSGKRFFIPEKQFFAPQNDFDLCLKPGIFDFVLKAEKENDYLTLRRIDVKP